MMPYSSMRRSSSGAVPRSVKRFGCDVVVGGVPRVAHLYMFGLDGGEHGVCPAERAVSLVFHGRVAEEHFVGEVLLRGVEVLAFQVARDDGCECDK